MVLMSQAKRLSEMVSAMVACLVTLALLAGPICATTCSGTECPGRSAASNSSPNCHGVTSHEESHFSVRSVAKPCNLANGTLAVLSRPLEDEFARAANSGKFGPTAPSASTPENGNAFPVFRDLWAGPPLTFPSISMSALILRI